MRLLLLGSSGQIGAELTRRLEHSSFEIITVDRKRINFEEPSLVTRAIREIAPQIVINAAAYTAVDQAESQPERAHQVNAVAPGIIAEECKRLDAWLFHYSTDYVFDGTKQRPYVEDDSPSPVNVYGRTKLEGEKSIVAAGVRHVVLRVEWVYSPGGKNFLLTVLRLIKEGKLLRIVSDQIGVPTSAAAIADITMAIAQSARSIEGLYHFVPAGTTSWHGFAEAIVREAGMDIRVDPISTAEFPTPARRPAYSVLDSSRLKRTLGIELPDWTQLLRETIATLRANDSTRFDPLTR